MTERSAAVITVSTRAAAGVYEDRSGPIVAAAQRRCRAGCGTVSPSRKA